MKSFRPWQTTKAALRMRRNVLDRLKNELSTDNEVNLESAVGRRLPSLRNAIQEYDQWRGLSMQRTTDKIKELQDWKS